MSGSAASEPPAPLPRDLAGDRQAGPRAVPAGLAAVRPSLRPVERFHVDLVRKTLESAPLDRTVRWCQRTIGARWILRATDNVREIHGADRLPVWDAAESYVCVCNHRSFFDLYVVMATLVDRALPHRIFFPVRSTFFYDNPLGVVVNGAMSFLAMYPPVFRDRKRQALNLASIDETVRLLRRPGTFVGLHPEGMRNRGDDPYALLPAQSGVGRIVHQARVKVIPVFVNGLTNDLPAQITGNFNGRGERVLVVFGAPIDFGGALDAAPSPRLFRSISERCVAAIADLGAEERLLRAAPPPAAR